MVASTAVVVIMVTIMTAHFLTGQSLGWLDFISIITVGIIGFVSVIFSLKYGRQLEEQQRELLALNTITEAVNHSVELNYVLQSALVKVIELMNAECGWIYLAENQRLSLTHQHGTAMKFFPFPPDVADESVQWIREPILHRLDDPQIGRSISPELYQFGMKTLASIPLERQGTFAGVMIISSRDARRFEAKKIALIQAFGNQISVALHNASLFEQLKQSEHLYVDLYEHSPDMYHTIDLNGHIVSCNLTERQTLGFQKDELIGKTVYRLYPLSQHDQVRNNLRKMFDMGQELRGVEEQLQKRDGSLIDVSVNTSIVYNPEGKPLFARVVLRDITEKKKMESKIFHAQKIDSIGNLAGGVAHDFNNILTSILGSASIMRRKINGEARWMKYIDLIETASRRGAALTRQLLTFARKDNPHVRSVDLNSVIDETIRLFEATTSKAITIKRIVSDSPVIVNADDGQMQQALLNLCLNSRDAMPNGGILSIGCRPINIDARQATQITDGRPGEYVAVTVADTGVGIPRTILNRIFEPFFTTKEQGKGTGLGLSVVYGVVKAHNGYLNVESEVDSGTVFSIYLPRVTDLVTVAPSPARRKIELLGGTERILIVEDEASVSEVGVDILKELGYEVEVTRNGREALQKLSESVKPFSMMLLDMNMPRMGGRATLEVIKNQYPEIKVLICSGYSSSMLEDNTILSTVDGYIQKPYELEDFAQTIRSVLDESPV